MRSSRLRTALASWILLVTVVQCSFAPDDPGEALYQFEPIRSDYTNLRGMNYIPSYAGSSIGIWNLYDAELVARELRHTRRLGANSVRVWLSYWSWYHQPEEFLESFRHLLHTCESLGLYLMPVLWGLLLYGKCRDRYPLARVGRMDSLSGTGSFAPTRNLGSLRSLCRSDCHGSKVQPGTSHLGRHE